MVIKIVKELRLKVDGLSQLVNNLEPIKKYVPIKSRQTRYRYEYESSKETKKAYNSLLLGKAWLGELLRVLGEDDPYKNTKEVKKVADTVNKDNIPEGFCTAEEYSAKSHIEKVDWIRNKINEVAKLIPSKAIMIQSQHSFKHLTEARFWLGFELQRVREENENE